MRWLLASTFLISLAMGVVGVALPLYARDLGASYFEVGMLGTAFFALYCLLTIPVGKLGDRRGRKLPLVAGLALVSCLFALYSRAQAVGLLLALRLVQGAGEASIWTNSQAAVADLSSPSKLGKALGTYGSSWASGFAVGPIVGGILYSPQRPEVVFLAGSLVALLATGAVVWARFPKPSGSFKPVNLRSLFPISFVGVVYVGVLSILFTLFPAYARDLGFSPSRIGLLLTLLTGIRAVLFIPMGELADRVGYKLLINSGMVGLVFTCALVGVVTSYGGLVVAISLLALVEGAVYPAMMSVVSGLAGAESRGYALGAFNALTGIGWGVMPGVGGVVADAFIPSAPYLMCAGIALGAVFLVRRLLK